MSKREDLHKRLHERLRKRQAEHRYRTLKNIDGVQSSRFVFIEGEKYLNFSSNDYLNLSNHPILEQESAEYSERFGTGAASSRLVTGSLNIHRKLEERIASLYKKEDALLFSTGFQANSTILPALTEKRDIILADELCHNSILTGCRASRASLYRFRHNDLDHLETFLKRSSADKNGVIWIVTESLFSMDGDEAPLSQIIDLALTFGAKLYVDDAHAFGVKGKKGLGLAANYPEVDVLLSTFGKAAGSFGAFVTSSKVVIDSLINYCNGFIYTTALPPPVIGSIEAAINLIPGMDSERNHLNELSEYLHKEIQKIELITAEKPSHILPIIMGTEENVLKKSHQLMKENIFTMAIRPPTVPVNSCRFRISLTSAHQKSDCDKFLDSIQS